MRHDGRGRPKKAGAAYPICCYFKSDRPSCRASEGAGDDLLYCTALNDTIFDGECPFYMAKQKQLKFKEEEE